MKQKADKWYDKGYDSGYNTGYSTGRQQGVLASIQRLQGTSIILSVYNQKKMLRQCLESIFAHTPEPHEIIVIDNGSTDGTDRYLNSLTGRVTYKRLERNLGPAAGYNQGLRLARGEYLVLLDTAATAADRWLTNLLACYQSYPGAGIVVPVLNGLSAGQQATVDHSVPVPKHPLAEGHNVPDSEKWQQTDGFSGMCLLMGRTVFTSMGYLDEGFDLKSYADDDYGIRAQLLDIPVVIARDAFIHCSGNTGSPKQENHTDEDHRRNRMYYGQKWMNTGMLIQCLRDVGHKVTGTRDFFPSHVIIRGFGETRYWLEYGVRHPIINGEHLDAVRLSQVELKNCPLGPGMEADEVLQKLAMISSTPSPYGPIAEGLMVKDGLGRFFQSVKGELRPIFGDKTLEVWQLEKRPVYAIADDTAKLLPPGIPVIAPPAVISANL